MKQIFQALARYNRRVNEEVMDLLRGLPETQLITETGSHYHSVYGAFIHIMFSDITWISRYQTAFPGYFHKKEALVPVLDEAAMEEEFRGDQLKAFAIRAEADAMLEDFINEVDDTILRGGLTYRNYKGVEIERIVWQTLLQAFNHQTHHRGSIAALLDIEGVQNDYSTLLTRI